MLSECVLQAEGFNASISLQQIKDPGYYINYAEVVVTLNLDPRLGSVTVKSGPTYIKLSELLDLADYFKQHIIQLRENPDCISDNWVPLELGFQVQAYAGEVADENDGAFTLRIMVNLRPLSGPSVYIGTEGNVTVESVNAFVNALEENAGTFNTAND